ncbi:MAG: AMMECR1 domain-containing protein [Candidatus Gracilibacteria bacterium]|nr:AMMECR1 domain-containing protein [Candidatus Gracilibacteria bacterium]
MNNIARKVLETYLNEKKILNTDELGLRDHEMAKTKDLCFVTLYKDGKIIASSGRVSIKKPNTAQELIENTLFCIKDPRFAESIKNPLEIKKINFRVDIMSNEQRKVVTSLDEIDPKINGIILISQSLGKIGVILPKIANLISTSKDLFSLVCKKAGLDAKDLKEEDYVLYKIESTVYSDF